MSAHLSLYRYCSHNLLVLRRISQIQLSFLAEAKVSPFESIGQGFYRRGTTLSNESSQVKSSSGQEQRDLSHSHRQQVRNFPDGKKLTKCRCKICRSSGLGQFFMTKDTGVFSGCDGLAGCREYTLRNVGSSTPKSWIRGGTNIGLVWDVTTNFHEVQVGIEI